MHRVQRFVGVLAHCIGPVDSAVYRARRTSSAPAVARQVSARTRSDEGGFPGCVARTSSPRVHGSGAVTCRTRARWDRAHQGYAGPARGRTSTSITRSRAPSLRSERLLVRQIPANSAHSQPLVRQIRQRQPAMFYRYVSGDCWSAFLGHVVISLDGSCACHGIFIQRLKGLAATAVRRGGGATEFRVRFSAFASPRNVTAPTANRVPSA